MLRCDCANGTSHSLILEVDSAMKLPKPESLGIHLDPETSGGGAHLQNRSPTRGV